MFILIHMWNKLKMIERRAHVGWDFAGLGIRSFAHSLFTLSLKITHFKERPWGILSRHSLQKSYVIQSLSPLFKKEWCEWFASERITRKTGAICSKNSYFSYVFDSFPPFLCPRANRSHPSSLICSFLTSNLSNSLTLLFTKERPWPIC